MIDPLILLLTGQVAPGLWRLAEPGDDLDARITAFGWIPVIVDAPRDKADLLDQVAAAARFPPWVGRNWDALHDALTDLSWLGDTDVIVIIRHRPVAAGPEAIDEGALAVGLEILAEAAEFWWHHGRRLAVVVSGEVGPPLPRLDRINRVGPVTDPPAD